MAFISSRSLGVILAIVLLQAEGQGGSGQGRGQSSSPEAVYEDPEVTEQRLQRERDAADYDWVIYILFSKTILLLSLFIFDFCENSMLYLLNCIFLFLE